MPADHTGAPWPETTYNGFSGPPATVEPRPRPWGRILAIGAAAAVVLGLGFGFLIRPNLSASNSDAAGRPPPAPVPIEVGRAPPPAPVHSDGKLEVLPPDVAAQAQAEAQAHAQAAAQAQALAQMQAQGAQPGGPLPEIVGPPPAAPATPAPSVRPAPLPVAPPSQAYAQNRSGGACAGGPAEQMICSDPGLAAEDRDLSRAFRRALAAGADPRALRSDQRDFMAIREDAASRSRRALESVMAQRIDELNAIAERARDEADDGDDEGPGY